MAWPGHMSDTSRNQPSWMVGWVISVLILESVLRIDVSSDRNTADGED